MTSASRKRLQLELERKSSAVLVRLIGSAGMEDAPRLQEKLEELASPKGSLIVLDLSGLDFISSMGLGAIIAGHLKSRQRGCEIRLASPRPVVLQLLETTRLTKLFGVFPSVEEALRSPRAAEPE